MAQQARKGATKYVVLQKLDGHDDAWMPIGKAEGHTKKEACKAAAKAEGEQYRDGEFRAVPARSWSEKPDLRIRNEQRLIPIFDDDEPPATGERVPAAAAARGGDE